MGTGGRGQDNHGTNTCLQSLASTERSCNLCNHCQQIITININNPSRLPVQPSAHISPWSSSLAMTPPKSSDSTARCQEQDKDVSSSKRQPSSAQARREQLLAPAASPALPQLPQEQRRGLLCIISIKPEWPLGRSHPDPAVYTTHTV